MIHSLVSIFDIKTGTFSKPVACPAEGAGVRAFGDAVNDPSVEYNKHPEDYSIWIVGTFNDQTGEFDTFVPRQLAQAVALLKVSV